MSIRPIGVAEIKIMNFHTHNDIKNYIFTAIELKGSVLRSTIELGYPKAEVNLVVWDLIEKGIIEYCDKDWDRLSYVVDTH